MHPRNHIIIQLLLLLLGFLELIYLNKNSSQKYSNIQVPTMIHYHFILIFVFHNTFLNYNDAKQFEGPLCSSN